MSYYCNFNMLCKYVKAYILHLFNSILFMDLIERYVPLIYMMFLDDFDVIPTYSWSFGILTFLYKHPCLACMNEVK
jgi:hypothetical protein